VMQKGTLYVVATPLGNLGDISQRAIETLRKADVIAAEDTRHSARLMQHIGVATPMIALHDFNERDRTAALLQRLERGESIALISDAGTPLISDPGFILVREVRSQGYSVVPVPGACAVIAALSASGLPTDHFVFEGFLPAKSSNRLERLRALSGETRTLVFYESPHRILDSIIDMREVFGADRQAVVAREMTKNFETIHGASLAEIHEWMVADPNQQRGEFVVLVAGAAELQGDASTQQVDVDVLLQALVEALPVKQAAHIAARVTGLKKNELYRRALALRGATEDAGD
jgi:16S rRNA (cytidine1402-2'-O)-methyltransferase